MMKTNEVTEAVLFKLKPNVAIDHAREALLGITAIAEKQPGFINRVLHFNEDGMWFDLVKWETMELAKQAAREVPQYPEAARAFELIDGASIQFYHFYTA